MINIKIEMLLPLWGVHPTATSSPAIIARISEAIESLGFVGFPLARFRS
jgi:hypothetical protein